MKEAETGMFKLNYHRRIQLSFLIFIFLPIVAVSVISFLLIKETMVEKLQLSNDNFMNVIVDEIERTIDDATFASHHVVNDSTFKVYLKEIADMERINTYVDYTNFRQIESDLSLITSKPLNNDIRMFLVNRQNFIISSNAEDLSSINRDLDQLLSKVNLKQPEVIQWLGMMNDSPGKKGNYYMARVIQDSHEQQFLSVLLISISEAYFEELFKPIQFGKVGLFDTKGDLIFSNTEEPLELSALGDSELHSVVTLDKMDWSLVYEVPKEAFTGQISRTFYTGIAGVFVFFVIFSISSMFIAKKLYGPIQKLQRVVRQFGMGNLNLRLEVKGKDDIAELGHSLNTMMDQLQGLIADIEQEQEQKRIMELEALFMQIRPHFLINTLNSIKCSLILQKDQLHSGVIDSLMSLLRAYLKVNEPAKLQEECRLIGNYIDIMKVRNEIPIELNIDLESGTEQLIIPKLILQPLIENAIVHGLMDNADAKISVRARRTYNGITIEIEDNGSGMDEDKLQALNQQLMPNDAEQYASYKRVGLINVVQRLKLTFGSASSLMLTRNEQSGVTVIIHIPIVDQLVIPSEEANL